MNPVTYASTRARSPAVGLSEAILSGLAPDGGLYIPERLPTADSNFAGDATDLPKVARAAIANFFGGDRLEPHFDEIAAAALDFPAPVSRIEHAPLPLFALELFHGPTAAFKDFGARFLAESLQRLQSTGTAPMTIMVATSGDTGGAVAAAFFERPWARVVILFPKGLVSARQERQLTCWGKNVHSLRVAGTFDDCQRIAKEAFADRDLVERHRLSSANSINIGRLLPQVVYYAASSLQIRKHTGEPASYIIPSGNLGNGFAAVWARMLGFPIRSIKLAHNANRTVPDFFSSGQWQPRASIATLASAMDVGNPSNMERLRAAYPARAAMLGNLSAESVDDAAIRARIRADHAEYGRIWCPHTATAAEIYRRLPDAERRRPWVIVATAHPAKFNDVVEPIIGRGIDVPGSLKRLLELSSECIDVPAELGAVAGTLA